MAFGPGDLIAVYPSLGHSLEVTGDTPVKLLGVMTEVFVTVNEDHPAWPESWDPHIITRSTTPDLNPTAAECRDCGQSWTQPADDRASHSPSVWAAEHECTNPAVPTHLGRTRRG